MTPAPAQEAARLAEALRGAHHENAAQQQRYAAALAGWQGRWSGLQVLLCGTAQRVSELCQEVTSMSWSASPHRKHPMMLQPCL